MVGIGLNTWIQATKPNNQEENQSAYLVKLFPYRMAYSRPIQEKRMGKCINCLLLTKWSPSWDQACVNASTCFTKSRNKKLKTKL